MAGVALLCFGTLMSEPHPKGLTTTMLATQAGLLCLAYAGAAWHGGPARHALGLSPPHRPLSRLATAAAIVGMILLSIGLSFGLELSGVPDDSLVAELQRQVGAMGGPELIYTLAGTALLPAVAEELLFRGFLLGWLTARWGTSVALIGSSCLFGAAHLDLAQGSAAAVLGLYLGGIRLRTGSVHAPILCHAANNAVAVLAPLILSLG